MSRGQTRRSLPHSSRSSQRPATACRAKTNHSWGCPLTSPAMPLRHARATASARLQSVRRGDMQSSSLSPGAYRSHREEDGERDRHDPQRNIEQRSPLFIFDQQKREGIQFTEKILLIAAYAARNQNQTLIFLLRHK